MPLDLGILASDSARRPVAEALWDVDGMPLDTALGCTRLGWPVHPLAPGRKTPAANCRDCRATAHCHTDCPCDSAGRWCHGFHAATTDADRVRSWWSQQPRFGVGVSCGPADLVVIDVDAHESPLPAADRFLPGIHIPEGVSLQGLRHGFHSLAVLAALRQAPDPAQDTTTLRVRTPSGGLHIWYRAEPGQSWRCSSGSSAGRALAWQVDVRAHGGYIIAPGTRTAAGTYSVCEGALLPAPLPGWLAGELERTGHRPVPPAQRRTAGVVPSRALAAVIAAGGGRDAAHRALSTVLAQVIDCAGVPEGAGFNDKLNRAAFTVGGLVGAGRLDAGLAQEALIQAAAHARPGQERRAMQTIQSAMSAGSRQPLHSGDRT